MDTSDFIWTDPERCGGVPCFKGTRIMVYILYDYLEAGDSVEDFLEQYPDLDRELVYGFLRWQREQLAAAAA